MLARCLSADSVDATGSARLHDLSVLRCHKSKCLGHVFAINFLGCHRRMTDALNFSIFRGGLQVCIACRNRLLLGHPEKIPVLRHLGCASWHAGHQANNTSGCGGIL